MHNDNVENKSRMTTGRNIRTVKLSDYCRFDRIGTRAKEIEDHIIIKLSKQLVNILDGPAQTWLQSHNCCKRVKITTKNPATIKNYLAKCKVVLIFNHYFSPQTPALPS